VKFSRSNKDKVSQRQFLDSNPLRDWVGIVGCLFAAVSVYQEISFNYFTVNGIRTSQALDSTSDNFFETLIGGLIDGMIRAGVSFGMVVFVVGGIRKLVAKKSEPVESADKSRKGKRVLILLVFATVFGFFAAYIGAFNSQEDDSTQKINEIVSGLKPVPLECRAQGDDKLCASGLQSGETTTLDFKLTYASARVIETDEVWSSSWTVRFDCSTNSVAVSNVEFYDLYGAKVKVAESGKNDARVGLESEYSGLLSEC